MLIIAESLIKFHDQCYIMRDLGNNGNMYEHWGTEKHDFLLCSSDIKNSSNTLVFYS